MSVNINLVVEVSKQINEKEVVALYKANAWSSAEVPEKLLAALLNSDTLVTARVDGKLVGLGNAISDGHLVVYYPHLLIHPDFQRQGIGRQVMELMQGHYHGFHQQMLTADGDSTAFYQSLGFERAGQTVPMWVYSGDEH
ncbi:GNAT family N-acetyltransferase [Shewanella pneumatophori]|uniref:GNAT family N-acetyltransferase n=1 Tax=Shewanella pneumatophori TaxID=314092 RepID=A0A9X1ZCL3_9GAMM|nr:GNAT family N-acetyltransferase [Shewanella pneumatophori]MCL1137302.1 GNAT family N-acetyltransferase [Shewanella pneumatophori]